MDYFPRGALPAYALERLTRFTAALDGLLVYDEEADTVRFNEPETRALLQNPAFFPETIGQLILRDSEEDLRIMGSREEGNRLDWGQVRAHVPVIQPLTSEEFDQFGLPKNPSINQADHFIMSVDPLLADVASQISPTFLRNFAEACCAPGLEVPRDPDEPLRITEPHSVASDFKNCLRRHLGTFAFVAVIAAVGAVIIVGTALVPITAPLTIWLIATLGLGNATIVLNCMRNPFW